MKWISPTQVLGICVVLALALRPGGVAGDPGVGWHLASGQWMLAQHAISQTDPFLFPAVAGPWIHNQWLSDCFFALLFRAGGWPMLELLTIAIGWVICLQILPSLLQENGVPEPIRMVAVLVTMLLFAIQWFLRPVIFSFLLFAICFRVLNAKHRWPGPMNLVPLLFLVWANLHPGFVIGLSLFFIRGFVELTERRLRDASVTAGLFAASLLATLVNPYGWELHRQMLELSRNRYFQNLNSEWLSPDLAQTIFLPYFIVAAAVIGTLLFIRRKGLLYEKVTVAFLLTLSFISARYIPFLAVPAGVWLGSAACSLFHPKTLVRFSRLYTLDSEIPVSALVLSGIAVFVILTGGFPGRAAEDSAIEAAHRSGIKPLLSACWQHGATRVFATPDLGGAITFYGEGKLKPFIDDRNELAGVSRYEKYFTVALGRAGWKQELSALDANCILAEPSPLKTLLSSDTSWKAAGKSDRYTAFVPAAAPVLRYKIEVTPQNNALGK